jgi:aspartyl/asparaginyl-tRNA synthetase
MLKVETKKENATLKVEYDHKQCAHIPQKRVQSRSHNHLRQNNFIKVHTPYLKGHWKKDVVNEPK